MSTNDKEATESERLNKIKLIKTIKKNLAVLLQEPAELQSVELFRLSLEQIIESIEDNGY